MADEKKKSEGTGSAVRDGGVAEKRVREQEGDAPEAPNYPDPEKESSTKPGTRVLARQKLAEKLQKEQEQEAKEQGKRMGMSKARKEAYAEFEAAGNK